MKYFGLDYGTTNSLLYAYNGGALEEISITPSAVICQNGTVVKWGASAWEEPDPDVGFIESPKQGIDYLDNGVNGVTYRKMMETLLYQMVEGKMEPGSQITLTIPNGYSAKNYFDMYEIMSDCLVKLLGQNNQISIHLLPEPVAAALFYVHKHYKDLPEVSRLVVCDIGGGTTDLCIVELKKSEQKLTFGVVKGMQHDVELGGNCFNEKIEKNIPESEIPPGLSLNQKKNLINYIKCSLSESEQFDGTFNGCHISLSRGKFEQFIGDELDRLKELMKKMLEESGMNVDDDNWYLLPIGGSCRIPAIRDLLNEVLPKAHQTCQDEKNIFDSVAQGAAIYSAWRAGALKIGDYNEVEIKHRYPHEVRFQTADGQWQAIVPKNAPDGKYPSDDEPNVQLVDINIRGDKYWVGDIYLQEGALEPLVRAHTKEHSFSLRKRKKEEIALQLGVEIKECRLVKMWIRDCLTKEKQEWSIN